MTGGGLGTRQCFGGVGLHLADVIDGDWQPKAAMDHQRAASAVMGGGGVRCWSGNPHGSRCIGSMYTALLGDRHLARTYGDESGSLRETCNDFGVRGGREQAADW